MAQERGINKKVALLQISIKNIQYLEKNLSPAEIIDLVNKIYVKVKSLLKDKDAYLYKFIGNEFFIIMNNLKDDKIKKENSFYLSKEILEKLKNHNKFLEQNHIPKIEYSMALDYGEVTIGKVKFEENELPIILGTPFENTSRAINLNKRKNITPLLLTDNIYNEIKDILSEYTISVMGYIKTKDSELYLYGSYKFNNK